MDADEVIIWTDVDGVLTDDRGSFRSAHDSGDLVS